MVEAIEELERFKQEMVEQLKSNVVEQASVILSTAGALSRKYQSIEKKTLADFQSLQNERGSLHSPRRQTGTFELPNIKKESLIDIEMEEANLSEYNSSPKNPVSVSRYSDLRGRGNGSRSCSSKSPMGSARKPRLGGAPFSPAIATSSNQGDRVGRLQIDKEQKVNNSAQALKEKESPMPKVPDASKNEVSIHVEEPSDDTPDAEGEVSRPNRTNHDGSSRKKDEANFDDDGLVIVNDNKDGEEEKASL